MRLASPRPGSDPLQQMLPCRWRVATFFVQETVKVAYAGAIPLQRHCASPGVAIKRPLHPPLARIGPRELCKHSANIALGQDKSAQVELDGLRTRLFRGVDVANCRGQVFAASR